MCFCDTNACYVLRNVVCIKIRKVYTVDPDFIGAILTGDRTSQNNEVF